MISIHTFLAEGDWKEQYIPSVNYTFQSTPSSQKVTRKKIVVTSTQEISIHTFLTEGDYHINGHIYHDLNFNPHLPRRR